MRAENGDHLSHMKCILINNELLSHAGLLPQFMVHVGVYA